MIVRMSDEAIKHAVERELGWDTRVEEAEIGVAVHERVVTLTGTVSSYAEKLAAEQAAHRVPGVLDVANDIQVRVPGSLTRGDPDIAQAVRHALEWDVLVPDERIRSTVSGGWVTLEGDVDLLRERDDAERAVQRLAGVRGVHDKIEVRSRTVAPDAIRRAIEEALERRAEREAERIQVSVSEGVVTLSGNVSSLPEKRAILGLVSHTPGVRAVNDQLHIRP